MHVFAVEDKNSALQREREKNCMTVDCTLGREKRGAEISLADLHLDPVKRKFWRNDNEIDLGGKECALLIFFMRHPNQSLSRMMISAHVWGAVISDDMVDACVASLQGKIDIIPDRKLFYTVQGVGYLLKVEE